MNWDSYFNSICEAVASKSPCLSRHIGTIIVRDKSIVSTGFNGPPRGIPHCGHERWMKDNVLISIMAKETPVLSNIPNDAGHICPRKLLPSYKSGERMELCPAQHAEENAISNAARNGVSTIGCICYLNSVIPCSKCLGTLINSGIVEIVCTKQEIYDEYSKFLISNSSIKIREFKYE